MTVVVTGASGALGTAYVRALVATGHSVIGIDRRETTIPAFARVDPNPYVVLGSEHRRGVPVLAIDLSTPDRRLTEMLHGTDAVVMTAANPLPDQSRDAAGLNHAIDVNTIDAAIDAGCRTVIYTSSLWRLKGLLEGDRPVTPDMSSPESHYGEAKQRTRDLMRVRASSNAHMQFVVNDHGWYPREAIGAPPMNVADRGLQTWIAESESQSHILRQIGIAGLPAFAGNFHGFILASKNIPNAEAVAAGHRPFILDLTRSASLGVQHRANVYDLYAQYRVWRDVPICMD